MTLRNQLGDLEPRILIILGSGLGDLANSLSGAMRIPYSEIEGFPQTTVAGHSGELVAGELGGTPVILQNGRFHLYEGHAPAKVVLPVRLAALLGAQYLIVTNAAGGLNTKIHPPALMLINDHVNLMWRNPLIGKQLRGETRWPDLNEPYDKDLLRLATQVARDQQIPLEEGVYAGVLGPSYETPAEVRMLRRLGCDAVGMSTVPEVIAASARGVRVLGISSITNPGAGLTPDPLSHDEVLVSARRIAGDLRRLIQGVVGRLKKADCRVGNED